MTAARSHHPRPKPARQRRDGAPDVDRFLARAEACHRASQSAERSAFRFGVDLGTATIVLTATNGDGDPIYWDYAPCQAVRDGVVVNFAGATAAVKQLKATAEEAIGAEIREAATAYPPGIPVADARACQYVLENAGLSCRTLIDEVHAAQALLKVDTGVIVDVGGGSTGVAIIENGVIERVSDFAGGGYHLDLILAGALRISVEDAEQRKRSSEESFIDILRPGIERVAESIRRQIGDALATTLHLVGGALLLPGAADIIANRLSLPVRCYRRADLITPFGIAMS